MRIFFQLSQSTYDIASGAAHRVLLRNFLWENPSLYVARSASRGLFFNACT